jgi:AraC family transcriptional regulator of adaptative response/methylated-DNA-[protein]-cysteine methyltransferase
MNDYQRIERAIGFIRTNFKEQPNLDEVAAHVALSPFHFQRLFTQWAGVSPKKFLQYLSLDHAKSILKHDKQISLFDLSYEAGLSGTGRLHDLFVNIEGMTPGEYKNGGEALVISYSFSHTPFGDILIASTAKGICHVAFIESNEKSLRELAGNFPKAKFISALTKEHARLSAIFCSEDEPGKIKLHLKGTDFQIKVWEALLKIPSGKFVSYGHLAKSIHLPNASRAVGTAIGSNPVAFIIPCHRVIQASGNFGNYMWGADKKAGIIGWEAAQLEKEGTHGSF